MSPLSPEVSGALKTKSNLWPVSSRNGSTAFAAGL